MRVNGIHFIERAIRKHPRLEEPLTAWLATTRAATWQSIIDLRRTFATADGVPIRSRGGRTVTVTVFNIAGNNYRLVATVSYRAQLVDVYGVLTHAEYDKGRWKQWFM